MKAKGLRPAATLWACRLCQICIQACNAVSEVQDQIRKHRQFPYRDVVVAADQSSTAHRQYHTRNDSVLSNACLISPPSRFGKYQALLAISVEDLILSSEQLCGAKMLQ